MLKHFLECFKTLLVALDGCFYSIHFATNFILATFDKVLAILYCIHAVNELLNGFSINFVPIVYTNILLKKVTINTLVNFVRTNNFNLT